MLEWQRIDKKPAIAGLALILLMFTTHVEAGVFGWFKKTELELSPEVNGTVTLHNKPVAGATVHRYLTYSDKEFKDSTTTDEHGRFQLPVKIAKLRVSPMFDTWVSQLLVVHHADQKIDIWSAGATNTLNYDSVRLLLSGIQCELSASEMKISIPSRDPQSAALWLVSTCNFEHENIIIEKHERN